MDVSIYSLSDPRTEEVRYVGKTQQKPRARLHRHVAKARSGSRSDVAFWIRSLIKEGLYPKVKVLEVVSDEDGAEKEKFWIAHHLNGGARLTNMTIGGYGSQGYTHSAESRQKIREARSKQIITDEHRQAISRGMKAAGVVPPNNSEALRGRQMSEESKRKMRQAHVGRKGRPQTAATRRKISESMKGNHNRKKIPDPAHDLIFRI